MEIDTLISPVYIRNRCRSDSATILRSALRFPLGKSEWGLKSRAAKRGGVSNRGASRSGLVLPFLSFFVPFVLSDFSGIFPICSGMVRGFSRVVPFLFLGLLKAPTRNSPERVRDTIWTFPEKVGKPPGLQTPLAYLPPN